ncbi:MAG: FtsX-like permease family protein [Sphaerochaeta sp.]|uniref:ABC transporter permease n=1 Tax=Sphaerochaeta sp. S2 TaxID=2798868 RepID=UPI0018E9F561|nr:FtsX-like permease family protein [Sphaerochaeta sp. S2]MBJ2356625.1 ABC transporter permease [Sphaerochaeta sp. S2]MDD4647518.1 FtsX-like permease family protein [Sphaerochaeta sp.]MDY0244361.1 FtsX-like permease family protein [Sphaerochaeta sp.]
MKQGLLRLLVLRKLGYKGSRAARKRILFNLVLITLVVGALVFAQIFVVSMSKGIADKYALLGNGHLQVHEDSTRDLPEKDGVLDVQLVSQSYALIYSPEGNKMVRLKGVEDGYFNELRTSQITLMDGIPKESTTLEQVLLSTTLADELQVGIGDRVALMLVGDDGIRPQFCVVGNLYDSGYRELDANLAFCDYNLIHRLFKGSEETYHELLVTQERIEPLKQEYQDDGFMVTSWDEENFTIATNLNTSRQAVLGVMVAVAMLCGYFISELSRELVEDDKHQIAMLTLLGARHSLIRSVYFYTVMMVTILSMIGGTLLGIVMSSNLSPLLSAVADRSIPSLSYYLLDFSVVYPLGDILVIVLVLLLVSVVSVQFSLRRVKRIEPLSCTHFD